MQAGCRTSLLVIVLGLLPLAGCRRSELVENELRARDIQYREALEELGRLEARNQSLQAEVEAIRKGVKLTPEQQALVAGVRRIVLGRLTGGYDNDGLPGDEALQVIIEPRDAAERSIPALRQVHVTALAVDFRGTKTPIGEWTVGADQLRTTWKQSLLSTGYHVILPWQRLPQAETIRVVVRATLPSGAVFEADKDVRVRLVPGNLSQPPESTSSEPGPVLVPALTQPYPHVPIGQWYAAPLDVAVHLGRPIPHAVPRPSDPWLNRPILQPWPPPTN
jgi:hypothetical protein